MQNMIKFNTTILFFSVYVFLVNYFVIFHFLNFGILKLVFNIINIYFVFHFYLLVLKSKIVIIPKKNLLFFILILFTTLSMDISGIYNAEFSANTVVFYLIALLLPAILKDEVFPKVVYSNLIGLSPFWAYGMYSVFKHGFYYNNGLGLIISFNIFFILVLIMERSSIKRSLSYILLIFYIITNLIVLFYSGSRTSLIAVSVMLLFLLIYRIKCMKYSSGKIFILILGTIISCILIIKTNIISKLLDSLFYKWGNLNIDFSFSGRTDIWEYTIKNYDFFGGGEKFFEQNLAIDHGHNTLINILGIYGVFSFIFLSLIFIVLIFKAITFKNIYLTLFVVLAVVLGTFETLISSGSFEYLQALFFLFLGLTLQNKWRYKIN